ncbi:MAG: DUF4184 family protein [Ilumatobacteraceae bacterium]
MPFTLFAHQVPAMGLKSVRPRWFDGTALCIGSMTPDLVTAFGVPHWSLLNLPPAWLLGIVVAVVVRSSVVSVAAAQLPDLGPFRLHSWRVLARCRHTWTATIVSVAIGIATHHVLDSFTHPFGDGARILGYDDIEIVLFGVSSPLATVFQWIGHSIGSMTAVWMLLVIGSHRRLEEWYGLDAVTADRSFRLSSSGRRVFWALTVAGAAVGTAMALATDLNTGVARLILATGVGVAIAAQLPVCRPEPVERSATPAAQSYSAQR